MKITIGAFDSGKRTVSVTFVDNDATGAEVTHVRDVNACLDAQGAYDAVATAARVDEVAAGVTVKIANGAVTNPPPSSPPETAPTA